MEADFLDKIFPFKRNWIEIGKGIKVHYVDEGTGRPIVMFHACPMWSFAYRDLIREFSRDYRVIAFDLPGFGLSSVSPQFDYTLNGFINITENLLEALQITNATLVLHGWGGTAGIGYAVRHPNNIHSLIILNSLAFSEYTIPWRLRICRLPWMGAKLIMDLKLLHFGIRRLHPKEVAMAYMYPLMKRESRYVLYRFIQDIPAVPEAESAQRILEIESNLWLFRSKPAMILWAKQDWLYPMPLLKIWKRYLPYAESYELDGGRYIQEEAPNELKNRIHAFLNRYEMRDDL